MNKFVIFSDSTCDLTTKQRKDRNIEYVRMLVNWTEKDGTLHEIHADLDWEEIGYHDYIELMRTGHIIMTSQVTEQEFDEKFIPYFEKGYDILYLACSSGLSTSGGSAQRLWNEKYSKSYPNCNLRVVDTLTSVMAEGLMVLDAADMRDEGKSMEEIAKYIEENRLCYNQIATVEDLSTLAKHGRVKATAAFFGNIFGVKPMLVSDANGINYAVEKAKGRRNSLVRCAEICKERVINPEKQVCFVCHDEAKQEDIDLLVAQLKTIGFKDVVVQPLGPIISASCGPATVGVYYKGQPETRVGE